MPREVLSEGKIGTFCIEEVEIDNGHCVRFEVLYHPGAAAVLPFLDDDRVLMLRQYRYAIREWLWEVPAGKLDPGESPDACVVRELEEETGYRAGRIEPLGDLLTAPGFTNERICLYTAHDLVAGTLARGPAEQIEMHEMAFDRVVAMIERGEINDAKTVATFLHCLLRRSA
jgi:8-oxo-dGTP pyrophosphatase MutT (NUDIX family)